MPKLNMIVKVEKKEIPIGLEYMTKYDEDKSYNQGQEDYGNRSVGLSEDKIFEILDKKVDEFNLKISIGQGRKIAQALKAQENKLIVEVRDE